MTNLNFTQYPTSSSPQWKSGAWSDFGTAPDPPHLVLEACLGSLERSFEHSFETPEEQVQSVLLLEP